MKKILASVPEKAGQLEKGICYIALIIMALLPVLSVLLKPFNLVIPFSSIYMTRFFLIASLFAAMLTTGVKEHISITIVQYIKNERIKHAFGIISGLLSAFVATVLFWDSLSFFIHSPTGRTAGLIPEIVFILIMAFAYGVMAIRFAFQSTGAGEGTRKNFVFPVLAVLLGSAAALPAIVKLVWGFDAPEMFIAPMDFLYDAAFYIRTHLIILLVFAALTGTPIFIAIGGIALVMLQAAGMEPEAVPIQLFSAFTDTDIIAIPLFTLTGFFLSESKAGERLVSAFRNLFSWLPGGMIIATVIICAFFTSFTGASGITILALGGILFTILKDKLKYPEKFTIGLLTSVGSVGLLFPPSLPIILVGATINSILFFMGETINYSIIDFFIGALIPGIILIVTRIAYGIFASRKVDIPREPFNVKEAGASIKGSFFEILMPFILIGGYFTGILTLVEVSAVSVIYIFIIEVFVNKDIALKDIPKVFYKAVPIIGGILSIIAMAKALSYAIIDSQVPEHFAVWMLNTVESRFIFLLLLNMALLVVGCLMDIFSAILVVLPLVIPMAQIYGIDPVHLGIIFIINLEVGFITPPVGMNLFLSSHRFKRPFTEICRNIVPFLLIQFAIVLLITYVQSLSTFLVGVFK